MFSNRLGYIFILGFVVSSISVNAAGRRQIDFQSARSQLNAQIFVMRTQLDPTLPAPSLNDEPEYTRGSQNTVYWNSSDVEGELSSTDYQLLVFEVEAQFDSTQLWGFVDVGVDSATFQYLPEGFRISYRLRYYAENPSGAYEMSAWSQPVQSVQDFSLPVLRAWNIQDLQRSTGPDWVVGQAVWIRVVATDSLYGSVMQIAIQENSRFVDDTTYYDIERPTVFVDTLVPYPILTPANEPMTFTVWVVDVAGQNSNSVSKELFWWPDGEEDPSVLCYPNPFSPSAGEQSVIKVNRPGFQKGRIFDPFGNVVAVLAKQPDALFFDWDGKNQEGKAVARGGYIFVIDGRQDLYCKIAVY